MTFEALLRMSRATVFAVCLARCRDAHEAEDRVQDVFFKAYDKLHTLRDATKARAWLHQIARRVCLDAGRRRRAFVPLPADVEQRVVERDPRLDRLLAAVEQLPLNLREPILLYYLDGRSSEGVGATLGLTPAAVRQRLVRARLRLHDLLTEDAP